MPKTSATPGEPVYQIKVTMDYIAPEIWRRFLLPASMTLDQLHQVLQVAFGWSNSHLHHFFTQENKFYEPPSPYRSPFGDEPPGDSRKTRLAEVLPHVKSALRYEYDMGDSWLHFIELEKILARESGTQLPVCTGGANAGPPDDCGGPPGYANLLEALADPKHPEHAEMLDWIGASFDPAQCDLASINRALKPKPARKAPAKSKAKRVWVHVPPAGKR